MVTLYTILPLSFHLMSKERHFMGSNRLQHWLIAVFHAAV